MLDIVNQEYAPNIQEEGLADGRTVYVASLPELVGIVCHAETADEAKRLYGEAVEEYLIAMAEVEFAVTPPT